eukprot:417022_1
MFVIMLLAVILTVTNANDIYDMSAEDFASKILMHVDPEPMINAIQQRKTYNTIQSLEDIPAAWDWRDHGAVTGVKNQEACGTCWAFSTTGNIEGQWFINGSNKLIGLSEEFLSDCDSNDCGMFGGWPYLAMDYIISRNGIPSEEAYPYCCDCTIYGPNCYPCMATNYNKTMCGNHDDLYCNKTWNGDHCPSNDWTPAAVIKDWMAISQNETDMAIALYNLGPLSIAMNAEALQRYKSGIYDPKNCNPKDLDHGVLVVGYGTSGSNDYWKVKNSWGSSWGMQGFILICRDCNKNGRDGECGILMEPNIPTF